MKLKAPENCDHFNLPEGRLDIPEDGEVDCEGADAASVELLISHGFIKVVEVVKPKTEQSEPSKVAQSTSTAKPPTQTQQQQRPQVSLKHNGKR